MRISPGKLDDDTLKFQHLFLIEVAAGVVAPGARGQTGGNRQGDG